MTPLSARPKRNAILIGAFFTGIYFAESKYKKIPYIDYTAQQTYLAPINAEITTVAGAIGLLKQEVMKRDENVKAEKLLHSDLYEQRDEISDGKQEIFNEYQELLLIQKQATASREGLVALVELAKSAVENPLGDEVLVFLDDYLKKDAQNRLLAARRLDTLIESEIDLTKKKQLESLRKTLLHYGLSISISNNDQTVHDKDTEIGAVNSTFQYLRELAAGQTNALNVMRELLDNLVLQNDQAVEKAKTESEKLREKFRADFDTIASVNKQIALHKLVITNQKQYASNLQKQIEALERKLKELEEQKKLAPPGEPKVRLEKEETYISPEGGGPGRGR